jgi:AcrR family transcriptional regulator
LSTPTLPTTPKRLRADAARNRASVLEAARAAFAAHGPDAQMDDIARRAGVGVGTVYRHFPTKRALADALVEERFERTIAYVTELLDEPDPWLAIVKSFEFCAATQEQNRAWAGVLAAIAGGDGAMQPAAHQLGQLVAITERMLDRARAAGAIRADLQPADMPPLYCGLAAVVQAGVADWRRYLELLLDGLRAPARG